MSIQEKYQAFIDSNKTINTINTFLNSKLYLYLIGLLMVISNIFALEIVCFSILFLLFSLTLLFSKDSKPLIAPLLMLTMGMSYKNGLSYNPNSLLEDPSLALPTIYDNPKILNYFLIIITITICLIIIRFGILEEYKKLFKKSLFLLPGLLVLCIGYLLGGIGYDKYALNDTLFALSNTFTLLGIFIYFTDTAFLNKSDKIIKYISHIALASGLIISLELLNIYLTQNVIVEGTIEKSQILTGWGIHNNFAGYLLIYLPFLFYLSVKEKNWLIYQIAIHIFVLAIVLTLCRTALVFLPFAYIGGQIVFFVKRKSIPVYIFFLIIILSTALTIVINLDLVIKAFDNVIDLGGNLNRRDELYIIGWENFQNFPILGTGWFALGERVEEIVIAPNVIAPKWKYHNIFIQLLASCGIIGLICFMFLIIYTISMLIKYKSFRKCLSIFFSIGLLMAASLADNFFFDYGFERYTAIFFSAASIIIYNQKTSLKFIAK